jgi:serine O-acetyltransferase
MITDKNKYLYYLKQDALALGIHNKTFISKVKYLISVNLIYEFQKKLRKIEYYKNCKRDNFSKIRYVFIKLRFMKLSRKLGFSIPENVFGPGLAIVHYGTIVVNANARVGANCRLHPSTCIGASGGTSKAPIIGNNVYIGPGAKIYGDITIGNNIAISANAAVGMSFDEENIMIGGVPAKKIKEINIYKIIKHISNL